jgi:hypothetical protein
MKYIVLVSMFIVCFALPANAATFTCTWLEGFPHPLPVGSPCTRVTGTGGCSYTFSTKTRVFCVGGPVQPVGGPEGLLCSFANAAHQRFSSAEAVGTDLTFSVDENVNAPTPITMVAQCTLQK